MHSNGRENIKPKEQLSDYRMLYLENGSSLRTEQEIKGVEKSDVKSLHGGSCPLDLPEMPGPH